jgi:hypothetical protein
LFDLQDFVSPFDILYNSVTVRILAQALARYSLPEWRWIEQLVKSFQAERQKWIHPSLDDYFKNCQRLRPKILKLTACAYLHISYDLPRCVANDWPGVGTWSSGPDFDHAESAYLGLTPIFSEAFREVARRWKVLGGYSLLAWVTPSTAYSAMTQWSLHLRTASWIHARRLHDKPSSRKQVEQNMLLAMSTALKDVSNSKIWTAAVLSPPHEAFNPCVVPLAVGGGASSFLSRLSSWVGFWFTVAAGFLAGICVGTILIRRLRSADDEIALFINELGQRTSEYVNYAVTNPEGLREYLLSRAPQ